MNLLKHQKDALERTKNRDRVAYYHDMGLGKTFTGSAKMREIDNKVNLLICQKSKIKDWVNHFENYFNDFKIFDGTKKTEYDNFFIENDKKIMVINYDLVFRRVELKQLHNFTLILDESSMIQNETSKRTKAIMKMKFQSLILLSGTPTGGRYEKLYSQMRLLGYEISKTAYWNNYVCYTTFDQQGFPIKIVTGYKNIDRLKRKMRELGCDFLKTDEVIDLPQQTFIEVAVPTTPEYKKFRKNGIVEVEDTELVGETTLTQMLYERQLCGQYNQHKLTRLKEILESTEDRVVIFYNFVDELEKIKNVCEDLQRPISEINGGIKDLCNYDQFDNSVTLVQYQSGAMGLNLQKSNKIIYFTLPLSSELFEQSKKRTHRIGQDRPCFYYLLLCDDSIEHRIYATLKLRQDFTEKLFQKN